MSEEEREIMRLLAEAWNKFKKLHKTHPSHIIDFCNSIHKCQDTLIHRIVQRDYPIDFPTYEDEGVGE